MDDLSSRFIAAYNAIHRHLCNSVNMGHDADFSVALKAALNKGLISKDIKNKLAELANLRNFVVHEHRHQAAVAVPSAGTVATIEKIRVFVLSPPLLSTLFNKRVETCGPDDPVELAAKKMHDGDFSQLPIYHDSECLGLLTAETIARWLASCITSGCTLNLTEPVTTVLTHQERTSAHDFLPNKEPISKAIDTFDDYSKSGKSLDAIILTHSGRKHEKPTGIITVFDVPEMLRSMPG